MSWQIDLSTWQTLGLIIDYSIKLIAIGFVPEGRRPSSSTAWLLAILVIPFLGLPLFLTMGSPYINKRRHELQRKANKDIENVQAKVPDYPEGSVIGDELVSMIKMNRRLTSLPATTGYNLGVHSDYEASIKAMSDAVDQAQKYIHVQIYIMAWDDTTDVFFQSLARAVQRGVKVRLLFDQVGSWKYPGYLKLGKRLSEIGVQWRIMLPLQPFRWRFRRPDLRNHRKMLIIDGEHGFIGSQNMIEAGYLNKKNRASGRRWVDVMVELSGPVVASMNMVFAVDWFQEADDLPPIDDHMVNPEIPDQDETDVNRPFRF